MLQPLVMGRAVSIHPLAVVLGIAAGGVLAGIVGALLAVPTIAFLNSAFAVLLADETRRPRGRRAKHEDDEGRRASSRPDERESKPDLSRDLARTAPFAA